jgi:tRNA U54 and U55 pseudouridine synthase Pus10
MSIFSGIFCRHRWKEIRASGMMGLFTPITWHEVTFECTKCHKQMHWKKDFSDNIYDKIKQGEFSTRELKRIFHKPIVINIPIFKFKLTKEIHPLTIVK